MKMEGVGDVINGRTAEVAKVSQPSPKEIGREFVRQYYTMLSERPQDVFRFYSHESYFVHDTEQPVQGQQKIQKAIERLEFVDCKARIYTVSGTATMNNGLVIQVCGELSTSDNPGRRFLQTFILCPQTPKKYYVHNDVFQWLDHAFGDTVVASPQNNDIQAAVVTEDKIAANGETVGINGLNQTVSASHNQAEITDKSSENLKKELCIEHIPPGNDEVVHDEKLLMNDVASNKSDDGYNLTARTEESSKTITDETTPKTWAKMVGGNQAVTTALTTQLQNINQTTQPSIRLSVMQNQASMSASNSAIYHANHADEGYRLYVGGITRHIIPTSIVAVEKDFRSEFEKFGSVAAVNVPRRVLDATDLQRTVFVFVIMRTAEGARKAFSAAKKERSLSLIHLKIGSLGFDGEAILSEQKGGQLNSRGPLSYRGVPVQGMARGGFGMRSGSGNGSGGGRGGVNNGGGGQRSLHPRHYNGGMDYRQANEHGFRH